MSVGVAILGLAHGHVGAYCNEWRAHPDLGVQVLSAWDHDSGRLEAGRKSYGLAAYPRVEDALAHPGVQAVVIGAETSLHAGLVEQAAAAGKAVVLQKPVALTLTHADRIVAAVARHGVAFTMAWQMRVDPQNLEIKRLMSSGDLGRIFLVRRRHGLATHLWNGFADLWHNDPQLNRDIWADDSAHPIDFVHWLLGVPESVTAEIESLCDPRVPNDNGVAIFRYPGGPLAEVCCSFTCAASENTTEVVAERGTIVQNFGDAPTCNAPRPEGGIGLKWYTTDTRRWTVSDIATPPDHGHRIRGLAGPIAEFLQGRRGPIATAEEGRTSLRMVLATYVSSRQGRRVRLDDPSVAEV